MEIKRARTGNFNRWSGAGLLFITGAADIIHYKSYTDAVLHSEFQKLVNQSATYK